VLHCNGILDEMQAIASAIGPIGAAASRRVATGEARRQAPGTFDRFAAEHRLMTLLQGQG